MGELRDRVGNQNLAAFVAFTSGTFSGVSHDFPTGERDFFLRNITACRFAQGKIRCSTFRIAKAAILKDGRFMPDNDPEIPAKISQYEMASRAATCRPRCALISVMHVGWDHHNNIMQQHPPDCLTVDQPSAALVADLKQRGLLKDTLVMWGSEFGRTSFTQGVIDSNAGRDHHGNNFVWVVCGWRREAWCQLW
jgi:hypothetical protein